MIYVYIITIWYVGLLYYISSKDVKTNPHDACKWWYLSMIVRNAKILYNMCIQYDLNFFLAPSSVSVLTESDKNDDMSNNGK